MNLELRENDITRDGVRIGAVKYSRQWGRWFWRVGDAFGDERSRPGVLSVVRLFLTSTEARAA